MSYKYPPYYLQYSLKTGVDSLACVSFSLCNMIYMMTGKLYSPRALAKMSATDFVHGNNVATVLNAADEQGLIPYDLWPVPETFTWDEFYAPIPQNILDKAEKLDIVLIPPDLTKSPIWTEFEGLNSNTNTLYLHMVAGIGNNQFVDSEPGGQIKDFTGKTIEWQSSIKINNLPTMTNTIFVHKAGTQEYGFYVPATSPETIKDKALNYGVDIIKPDGSISFEEAKEINGL